MALSNYEKVVKEVDKMPIDVLMTLRRHIDMALTKDKMVRMNNTAMGMAMSLANDIYKVCGIWPLVRNRIYPMPLLRGMIYTKMRVFYSFDQIGSALGYSRSNVYKQVCNVADIIKCEKANKKMAEIWKRFDEVCQMKKEIESTDKVTNI